MRFGIECFGLSARHYPAVAKCAEDHGFDDIYFPEHLVFPVEMPPLYSYNHDTGLPPMTSDAAAYDPWVIMGGVAALTDTIRMATSVFILPLRHPISVARSVITVDRMSGGRVVAGVGAGWLEDEFEIMGLGIKDRGRRMDESIEVLRKLWSQDDVIEHHGEFFDFKPITFEPKPVDRRIPIMIGGITAPALRRAGRLGDGWFAHKPLRAAPPTAEEYASDVADLRRQIDTIHRHREEAGRADQPFEIKAALGNTLDDVERMEEMGVTSYSGGPSKNPTRKDDFTEWIKKFSHEIISNYR